MFDSPITITKGADKVDRIYTSGESENLDSEPIDPESTFPTSGSLVKFEIPNELTEKTIADAESGINVVECRDEEELFNSLDE